MNNILIYGGAAFLLIVILIVGFFVFKAIRERKESTNLELPNLDEMDKEERMKRMKENREEFSFGEELSISDSQLNEMTDEEIEAEQYLGEHKETSVNEDFGGLLNSNGEISRPTPKIIKNKIDLPNIELNELENSSLQSNDGIINNDTNIHQDEVLQETEDKSDSKDDNFSLPSID